MKRNKKEQKELALIIYTDKLKECFKEAKIKEQKQEIGKALKEILDERKIPQINQLRSELDFERSKNRKALLCINQLRSEIARLKLVINALNY